jgi:cell division septal protein FtsQ
MTDLSGVFKRLQTIDLKRKPKTNRGKHKSARSTRTGSKAQMRGMPPVLTRHLASSHALPRTTRTRRARRRFDIALPTPGAEIRLPSLPVVQVGWRWLSLLVAVALVFLLYQLYASASFRVEAAEINGLFWESDFSVNSALEVSGKSILSIDPVETEEQLLNQFPLFTAADVEVGLPNLVVISVTERIPALTWVQGATTQFVDVEGWAIPSFEHPAAARLPVVHAEASPPKPLQIEVEALLVEMLEKDEQEDETEEIADEKQQQAVDEDINTSPAATLFMSEDMLRAVLILSKRAPEDAPLVYNERHGLGWEDPRGWVAHFGSPEDISMKLTVYESIVAKMAYDGIQPSLISVEYVHAPYYRMEN